MNTDTITLRHMTSTRSGFAIRSILGVVIILAFIGLKVYNRANPWESLGADTTTLEPEMYYAQELEIYRSGDMRVQIETTNKEGLTAHWLTEKDFKDYYENGVDNEYLQNTIKSQAIAINRSEENLRSMRIPKGNIYVCFENLSETDVVVSCEIFINN